jgi:chorismate dehydratase
MLFGSISYLNLLPFQLFLKRHLKSNAAKMSFRYKRAVPSQINYALKRKAIHAAFISSVESRHARCTDLGIIAQKRVYSVLLLEGEAQKDPASATSNRLAEVLGLEGRVLIGDAALTYYLRGGKGIDMAEAWHEKTGLPFVFARLCYNRNGAYLQKLAKHFASQRVRIPQYILKKEAAKRGITPKELTWYLSHIHYSMDWKAKRGLKKFLRVAGSR